MRFSYNGKIKTKSANTTIKRVAQKKLEIIKAEIIKGEFKYITKVEEITLNDYSEQFLGWVKIHRKQKSWDCKFACVLQNKITILLT